MPGNELNVSLPPRLMQALQLLAEKYYADGLNLFIFGSFARGDNRLTSDLDLGVEWHKERNLKIFRNLYQDVQALPTIRKIELVDFTQMDSNFRQVAGSYKIYLLKPQANRQN